MVEKYWEGTVVSNNEIAERIYDMKAEAPGLFGAGQSVDEHTALSSFGRVKGERAEPLRAGQFAGIYTGDGAHLLPRPISICEALPEERALRFVYRTAGAGTELFSGWRPGKVFKLLAPLGNGFTIADAKRHIVIGGGVGIPPLLELVKELSRQGKDAAAVLGYADEVFLTEDFRKYAANVFIATESGREGARGNVMAILDTLDVKNAAMYACGPKPMLKALSGFADVNGLPLQISTEERMACGIGSCLCCAVKTAENNVTADGKAYLRVCKDGPVFDYREVAL